MGLWSCLQKMQGCGVLALLCTTLRQDPGHSEHGGSESSEWHPDPTRARTQCLVLQGLCSSTGSAPAGELRVPERPHMPFDERQGQARVHASLSQHLMRLRDLKGIC